MFGHHEPPAVVEGELFEAEKLLGAHIAVEISQTEADRAFFFAFELLVEFVGARQAEPDQAIKPVMRGKAQDAVAA